MAGHSKWANIQHRKNTQDAKRGKLFTKLIREITVAARLGGGDTLNNSRLRLVVDKGLSANMSKEAITRAIKKGTGEIEGVKMEEIRYEGYGPQGVALLIDTLTDNRNRTVAEIRHAFDKYGGSLGKAGSVAYLFHKKGIITFAPGLEEENILNIAIEENAEDVFVHEDKSIDILVSEERLLPLKNRFERENLSLADWEVTWLADTPVYLDTEEQKKMQALVSCLEDLEDVQNVYSNQA